MDETSPTPKKRQRTTKRITLELSEAKALETMLADLIKGVTADVEGTPGAVMADMLRGILAKLQATP